MKNKSIPKNLVQAHVLAGDNEPVLLQQLACESFAQRHGAALDEMDGQEWFSSFETEQGWLLRWQGHFDFWVTADGQRIEYCLHDDATDASVETYLLAQAHSFALVARGREPLHGGAVALNGKALAYLGAPTTGKSSLTAALLAHGGKFLTDDLLVLTNSRDESKYHVEAGLPRLKLFPDQAKALAQDAALLGAMSARSPKQILTVSDEQRSPSCELGMLVELVRRGQDAPKLTELLGAAKLQAIYRNVFNPVIQNPKRQQQLFRVLGTLCEHQRIFQLSIPDDITRLPEVVDFLFDAMGEIPC